MRVTRLVNLLRSTHRAGKGGVEKHLECRSTVSRGHFSTGTHGHLGLSHFLHDLVTLWGCKAGRPSQGARNSKANDPFTCRFRPEGTGRPFARSEWSTCAPPPGPTLMMIEWVRQLGGRQAGDAHSWGAPPGVVSQARGAISVGSPSHPASSLAGYGGMSPCPPPAFGAGGTLISWDHH